jgi:hypothetical protein
LVFGAKRLPENRVLSQSEFGLEGLFASYSLISSNLLPNMAIEIEITFSSFLYFISFLIDQIANGFNWNFSFNWFMISD